MARRKVLFLCIGNSCRSQMAEGFARTYGSDVIEALSAGLAPAISVSPATIETMKEKPDCEHFGAKDAGAGHPGSGVGYSRPDRP